MGVCYRSTLVKMKSLLYDNTDPLLVIWGECGGGALNLRYWKCLGFSRLDTKNSCSEISRILVRAVLDKQNWSVSAETALAPFKEKERIDISAHNISCLCPLLSAEKLLSPKGQQDFKTSLIFRLYFPSAEHQKWYLTDPIFNLLWPN